VSNNRIVFEGLEELKRALRELPAELTGESSHIVESNAIGAADTIKANYARVSGTLVKGVSVKTAKDQFAVGAVVKSKAPHAWMYENGTQVRHNDKGANRGRMPPAPPGRAFIPVIIRARKRMYEQLADLLKRKGLQVTGDAR